MDQFYLKNADLFQTLIKKFKSTPANQDDDATAQMTSPDMVVTARIRPLLSDEASADFPCAVFPRSDRAGVVDAHDLYNHPRGRPILKSSNYKVDKLYTAQTTTEEIYTDLASHLVPLAWDGGIGTLFAYGQTGSGKTYTVSRLEELAVEALMDGRLSGQRDIYMTIIDLAGNSAFDLLNNREPIMVLEDSFGVTQLAGATEHHVQDAAEVIELIERAASFRLAASTIKNDDSSRSHGICRIRISNPAKANAEDGLLYLVDLAGSEAARDKINHGAERMKETKEINISLSVLKECIRGKVLSDALASDKKAKRLPHVPFRQSAMTKVLKHVFDPAGGRTCKTVIIACVNPSLADIGPSKNTLRYAEMLRVLIPRVDGKKGDPEAPMNWNNAQVREWIMKNSGTPPISPGNLAPGESGAQLLRLSPSTFESRCLKTPGVTEEQAKAFRFKLWRLHIDSQKTISSEASQSGETQFPGTNSSRDPDSTSATVAFKQRIRPGMAVAFSQSSAAMMPTYGAGIGVILSPATVMSSEDTEKVESCYTCALVLPGSLPDAYELHMWRQVDVDVSQMEKEVILEYSVASRYYYLSV